MTVYTRHAVLLLKDSNFSHSQTNTAMAEAKIIKKYPNRSLYDTSQSKYISLSDLKKYVLHGQDFVVWEVKSKTDITRQILLQIIADEENSDTPLFTVQVLRRFIRVYGNTVTGPLGGNIEQMSFLLEQQTRLFWEQLAGTPEFSPAARGHAEVLRQTGEQHGTNYRAGPGSGEGT